jgi:hypothetical protein
MTRVEAVRGNALRVGDTIEVWWSPRRDTITRLTPYTGPLKHIFTSGASIAEFALLNGGMTIDHNETYFRISTERKEAK